MRDFGAGGGTEQERELRTNRYPTRIHPGFPPPTRWSTMGLRFFVSCEGGAEGVLASCRLRCPPAMSGTYVPLRRRRHSLQRRARWWTGKHTDTRSGRPPPGDPGNPWASIPYFPGPFHQPFLPRRSTPPLRPGSGSGAKACSSDRGCKGGPRRDGGRYERGCMLTRVAVTAGSPDLDQAVDGRFGRAAFLLLVDPDTLRWESVENPGRDARGGAGIQVAQFLSKKGSRTSSVESSGPRPRRPSGPQESGCIAVVPGPGPGRPWSS